MLDTLPKLSQATTFPAITRGKLETLQLNLGYRCNQQCKHCHVNAGPKRTETMDRETVRSILKLLVPLNIQTLDLTGGAPEMNPHFKMLVHEARQSGVQVIDRCNLTILSEPGYEDMAEFLAQQQVEIISSMPCYLQENVDGQRGKGVYNKSIAALKKLNALGYGQPDSGLKLNLVYNPTGPFLPPPQEGLSKDYKQRLLDDHGIVFNHLFTITNMPIQRFGSTLLSKGEFDNYMQLLRDNFSEANLQQLMCRNLISVDWHGYLYDCDFNQMLKLPLYCSGRGKLHVNNLLNLDLEGNPIVVLDHCYGCTAGQGSSCGGALS
jgi:radical SAM/Cys-rich protein